ncbi:flagellar biosynthetic protein FliO [Marinimicrobium sp. ARAG 43.8]|uniref:flagellar biosynthetic protein FliO n=1 Tax=Marinimicrobium sp. ARAG 43.8 TaxID=3418719 RepID=UPI003CE83F2C
MEGGAATQLLNIALSLLLVVGLILALAWMLRRFGHGGPFNRQTMKVVASLPLGTRERLMLVEVGGQQLLLGITPQQIRTLHVFDEPIIEATDTVTPDFRHRLMTLMNKNPPQE